MENDPNLNHRDLILRGGVITASDTSLFAQTGQLDWVAFLKGTAEASIAILTRLSAAGVEPLTLLVAQQLWSTFQLSSIGESRVTQALSSLHSFSAFGDVLWFGFGVKHVVRSLATTREGVGCVGLCAALTETHSIEISALVLRSLADVLHVPREASPSIKQWKALASTCAGTLAKSTFGDRVQVMIALYHQASQGSSANLPEASGPDDIAGALALLAKVTKTELECVTYSGGPECGWLAAVADWLLGLRVRIEDVEGKRYFDNALDVPDKEPQIIIIVQTASANRSTGQTTTVQLLQKSYKLGQITDLVRNQVQGEHLQLCIRVAWEHALQQTFGHTTLCKLLMMPSALATALGSAARIFQGIALAESDPQIKFDYLRRNIFYTERSYGAGLLDTIMALFQELPENVKTAAQNASRVSFKEAVMTYEAAIVNISTGCPCSWHGDNATDQNSFPSGIRFDVCLVGVVELIIDVARLSSNCEVDCDLMPTRNGLIFLYDELLVQHGSMALHRLLGLWKDIDHHLLADSVVLFSGRMCGILNTDRSETISAVVHQGICLYFGSLRQISHGPEGLSRIHILPGCIASDHRQYPRVQDAPIEVPTYPLLRSFITNQLPNLSPIKPENLTAEPVVTETENEVLFSYRLCSRNGNTWLAPAALVLQVAKCRGLIRCTRRGCQVPKQLPTMTFLEGEGQQRPEDPRGLVVRLASETGLAWAISIVAASHRSQQQSYNNQIVGREDPGLVMLRYDECISCCIRAAASNGWQYNEVIFPV